MPKTLAEFDVTPPRHAQLRIYYMKKATNTVKIVFDNCLLNCSSIQFDSIRFDLILSIRK